MHLKQAVLITASIFLLSACATNALEAQDARKPTRVETITIPETISYRQVRGLMNLRWEIGLMPSLYVAYLENDRGTFFRGSGRPVWQRTLSDSDASPPLVNPGGIWVPKSDGESPRLFLIRELPGQSASDALTTHANVLADNAVSQGAPIIQSSVAAATAISVVGMLAAAEAGTIYIFDPHNDENFLQQLNIAVRSRLLVTPETNGSSPPISSLTK